MTVGSKEVEDKLVEKIIDIPSSPEKQPVSTKSIIMKEHKETKQEPMQKAKTSLSTDKNNVAATEPKSKVDGDEENQPKIVPISQEEEEVQVVTDTSKHNINTYSSMPIEECKAERKRLSFQAMEESSESELTPSPSPKIQSKRLKAANVSSSSEEIKTESADSYMEEEDFIRKQIMGMCDEEEMSHSEDEKEKKLANKEAIEETELDNVKVISKSLCIKSSTDIDNSQERKNIQKSGTAITKDVSQSPITFKKAIPVMKQRQSTDEEVESITDSLSKGSSSVHASSFTPGSSPTSASSLEDDSDSSSSHAKVSGDKQHRKGKHRQKPQPLPTIEDSSEDEKMREEKSRRDQEDILDYRKPSSPTENVSSTEDLRQAIILEETSRTSGSEYSASIESEPEARQAIQRGRKPPTTVIPFIYSPPFEDNIVSKSLKSAEEAYEEILQKAKAIPGESPPDIEPLYEGMAIEDYLYESLVEEPEIRVDDPKDEEDTDLDSLTKLRSPEQVYEEMMQKKRELVMIEEEFQQAQIAMESSSSGASVIPTNETLITGQIDTINTGTETPSDALVKKKKRPAPPRPSEPPKRTEITVVPSTPSGSISFVRPMVPQNPAFRKALFPIPDLKITQCSSGEEEDDSLADEYGVGISSDITPSDDSETKEYPFISSPLAKTYSKSDFSSRTHDYTFTHITSITANDIAHGDFVAPVTITEIQQSIESQGIRGLEKVVSSMSHMYSSSISTSSQPPEMLPNLVTEVVTTELQRTTVSVVHERVPQISPPSVAITIQPDVTKVQSLLKQNGKIMYPGDVIDLRTMKVGVDITDKGMDLTPPESLRQSFSSECSARQITAVQPEIVNLSAEIPPATTLTVVTNNITIVTCTATIASYNNTPAEKPLNLQGPVTSLPLPLTTYKAFEPLAQIVYRPVNSQGINRAAEPTFQDIPINLSFGVSSGGKQLTTLSSVAISNGGPIFSSETAGAIDLSNYRPVRTLVAWSGTSPGVMTTIIDDDDGTPVDLTAGRRSTCCDVIYKLPFTGSCRTQPPITNQPENRDDHYRYDIAGLYGIKEMTDIKTSVSESNLTAAGMFSYDPKNGHEGGSSDGAIDLTATQLSVGKALDYTSKTTGVYPEMATGSYSQGPTTGFGANNILRASDGVVYSSVATPVPSTYAITTQPGSVLNTPLTPISTIQNQTLPHQYGFIPSADPAQIFPYDTGLPKDLLPTAFADIIPGYPEMYSDTTLEAIAASLDALASSPIFPGLDNTKMAQYQMEREFLELEKLKQLCLAEELEWERQEIQRYREHEQLMVQRELEELQALKQQLLLQQEEEHHAHMVAQHKTYTQQTEQLQQIQQLQLQLQRQLEFEESQEQFKLVNIHQADQDTVKKIIDSGVQTDDEDSEEKQHIGRKKKNKRNVDSSGQTDVEDQDEWDAPTKARRRSRKHSSEGKHGSKVSSIAIQTVAEISVQTDHSGTIKRPKVHMDTKVEIIKHISAPENSQRGGSLSCQTDSDRRHTPIEVGYSTHLTADLPSKPKVFYNTVSPLSTDKLTGGQKMLTADPTRFSSGPRILKAGQKSLSDPKSLSPATEDRMSGYADSYSGRGSSSGTGRKVKRTLPDPPSEDDSLVGRGGYSSNSARRRLARSTTMARAKILQDIDKELDLVERESSKLRKKQAELDEEEKEIDAKLRYLEMGINRRKEALLKEREKRERAYLQGVAEERDYMSDSEVSNIRETTADGHERPRTAPQSEFEQFIPPQTEADSQYNTLTSPYSHYGQYVPQTQTTSDYNQQNLYQQQSLYHQQVSPYTTLSLSHAQDQTTSYQHALLIQQGKPRQTSLSDLEPKITTNYEVMHNQPLQLIVPTSTESGYGVAHLGAKYGNLDLRLGLEERSVASSPMSSISADSFYADIDHHNARNYVLIEDIGELTKTSPRLSNTGLGSGFNLPDKELSKADRLLRAAEVADFLGSPRLQSYVKGDDETMEEPYELKLLKQQIKQEFRRGTEGLEHLTGLGLPHYLPSDSNFRHFPKGEKYSIGRLTLEKQAAKQLPAAVLYQKQMKNKKALIDPKAITKCSPIQESRDLEPDFSSYIGSGASSVTNLAATARLLQDEITFGLRKNLSEQQKILGSSLGGNVAGSLNLGQHIGLGSSIRTAVQDDSTYPSGNRSRPSSRPSSVYGLDLSIKRDLSSSSLRLKTEGEVLDAAFAPGVARAKPTSLPISQSRGRIPIVAQNSEEESPLSPVGQPMGMARASAGPLPPIAADSRDQFGSSHSLPEVQQHMREESRTRGYDRDIAFIIDDLQGAMSDSEALSETMLAMNRDDARIFHESIRHAYHLRREDTDWFDKPREGHPQSRNVSDRRGMKLVPYAFPHTCIKLKKDENDSSVSGNGLGIHVVGGKEIPGSKGEIGAFIAKVIPGGVAEQTGKIVKGMQVLEWNGVPLTAKTYEEVQCIMGQPCAEAELCVRLDLNMLSDPEYPQALEHHVQAAGGQRSPGVDPQQLAAELQKVSQQQAPGHSAILHSGTGSAASSGVPSPGQPASPAVNKKQRPKPTEVMKCPHPITGEIQLQINYDRNLGNLIVHVLQAKNLAPRDNDSYSDPFVKVYLLPGRGQVMVVQNASADNKRRTRYAQKTMNPEWNQTVIYKNIHLEQLKKKMLEVTVWDYDRSSSNDFLGEVLIDLSNTAQLDNTPRWLPLREQSESIEQSRAHHAAQGPPRPGSGQGQAQSQGYMSGDGNQDSPRNSVIKSRSHGIFPDPAKDMQMLSLEKSHSSPGSSKSSSDGQLRSHGPSRSQSKSSVTQAHLEDAGIAIAAAEAAVQQSRLQPSKSQPCPLVGDAYGGLDGEEGEGTGVDSAIFQVPRIGKTLLNGTDKNQAGTPESEGGKTQVMGEIKVALKKEVKTEGDQLVLEILQCRNITYKFKSPDHLPDLYVKLYVVNVATQKRIIKKKTRICRHDREPSFNETFRFPLNPTGHSIQLFLVSNGGKFMKKTLIGEAYIWLDKVDMRKRVVSWHKLFVSSTQTNP
ncbi:protein piccolo [Brachionichthys hirsutus]|uniref:protein piccolo n=1 Tax=Brachionichthys hirsutus TaxID=412623 RepID=UPI00360432AB